MKNAENLDAKELLEVPLTQIWGNAPLSLHICFVAKALN